MDYIIAEDAVAMTGEVILVSGARPNFMKISPICKQLEREGLDYFLVHTGQHYDDNMSSIFFDELDIRRPDVNYGIGSGTHAGQTARIMMEFEKTCLERSPKVVLVVGDVNSTIACALVASKMGIPVGHVEAGLRSWDRTMPEEINRVLTDAISDYLYTPSADAVDNLIREGVDPSRIENVGNVMVDTLLDNLTKIESQSTWSELGLNQGSYGVLTLHRPSNVDEPSKLEELLTAIAILSETCPIVFPIHPRTSEKIRLAGLQWFLNKPTIVNSQPLGYLGFLSLVHGSRFVLTDSGGLQEETTVLGVPCFTLRENTERPITVTQGSNSLIGTEGRAIDALIPELSSLDRGEGCQIDLWDGFASMRIINHIKEHITG